MPKIPSEQQRLQRAPGDAIAFLKRQRALGHTLRGEDLLEAVELSIGQVLPSDLRELFREFAAPESKRRGRRPKDFGRLDFAMGELDRKYSELLRDFAKDDSSGMPPSERAYRKLAEEMWEDFPNGNWDTLRNEHSKWRNGHLHSFDQRIDSEDFEAEIDRQFPPP